MFVLSALIRLESGLLTMRSKRLLSALVLDEAKILARCKLDLLQFFLPVGRDGGFLAVLLTLLWVVGASALLATGLKPLLLRIYSATIAATILGASWVRLHIGRLLFHLNLNNLISFFRSSGF